MGIVERVNKPAPKWFRKLKRAATLLSDTAVVMLLALGYADDSLIMLILRVGISGVLQTLEAVLTEE